MINFLSFWSDIGFSIKQALRTFSCKIAAMLYEFIVDLYNVFMYTARAEILEDSFIQEIYRKVGMILGIFMVFKLAFSLIQSLIDPNKFNDEKTGFVGIIKRCVISIVLLGITPSIFNMAFDLQNLIVGSANDTDNIIYKIVVGTSPSKNASTFGHTIASELYFGFYTENEPYKLNDGLEVVYPDSGGVTLVVNDYNNLKKSVTEGRQSFNDTVDYLSVTNGGQYVINWNGLFAIGVAIFMIYILITYCIQVATRVIQLAYLQLIAPVPILSYISDPDGAFKNWIKQCTTTYLDLFIRLAIIYFIITVSTMILQAYENSDSVLFSSTGLEKGSSTLFWVRLFLIIGSFMFGKRVPDLFKELFPNLGGGTASLGFGLKSPKKTLSDIPLLGGATNKVLGYAGKVGKWGWKKTGGRGVEAIKNNYKIRKDDRSAYKEQNKLDNESNKVWKEYGNDFETNNFKGAFKDNRDKNGEYAASYEELKRTKDALKGFSGDTNSAEYRALLAEKEKAEKNHNVNRDKYKELARREDQLKRYNDRHPKPNNGGGGGSNNNSSSNFPTTNSSSPQQNINNNQSSSLRDTQQSSNVPHRPDQYDERMEYATNRYYELQDSGASDEQLQQQLDNIRNLTQGREEAERYCRDIDNQIDDANERNNDGFGGQ